MQAATGIAQLLCLAMVQLEGISVEEARDKIWMVDVDGLLSTVIYRGFDYVVFVIVCGQFVFIVS